MRQLEYTDSDCRFEFHIVGLLWVYTNKSLGLLYTEIRPH